MARVTRSRKIEVAEDQTAHATQPLHSAQLPALIEVANNLVTETNFGVDGTMSAEDKTIAAEIKGLKAAYHKVLGKTTRKGRSKKKDKEETEDEVMIGDDSTHENPIAKTNSVVDETSSHQPAAEEVCQVKGSDGSLILRLDKLTLEDLTRSPGTEVDECPAAPPSPPKRLTRRQFAQKQEGQYYFYPQGSELLAHLGQRENYSVRHPFDGGLLLSPQAGWTHPPGLSWQQAAPYLAKGEENRTDNYLSLAEKALAFAESNQPTTSKVEAEKDEVAGLKEHNGNTEEGQYSLKFTSGYYKGQVMGTSMGGDIPAVDTNPLILGRRETSYSGPSFRGYRSVMSSTSDEFVIHQRSSKTTSSTNNASYLAEKALDEFLNSKQQVVTKDQKDNDVTTFDSVTEFTDEQNVGSRTPARQSIVTLDEVERTCQSRKSAGAAIDSDDDSFVEAITSRSPAKPISRIEDSVEALDQLEEAMEAVNQAALAQRMLSPQKRKSPSRDRATEENTAIQRNSKTSHATMRANPTVPRTSVVRKTKSMILQAPDAENKDQTEEPKASEHRRTIAKRPNSLQPPKPLVKSTKPKILPNFELPGEAVARKLKEQREARQAQRDAAEANNKNSTAPTAPRIKSTKQPTRPTFELPGEAISRRKREAYAARLKAQEEEERKRREFKATKPLRPNLQPSTAPRDTIASRARLSKVGTEATENNHLTVAKRSSNVGAHRPSIAQLIHANTSAPRAPGSSAALSRKPSTTTHGPSMSGLPAQRTVSASDVQVQRQRAKEIYNRDQKLTDEIEKEKRERESAAKLAREAAAERGRQASREWAEKQRAKKAVASDTGMSRGYGPGGQLGLK